MSYGIRLSELGGNIVDHRYPTLAISSLEPKCNLRYEIYVTSSFVTFEYCLTLPCVWAQDPIFCNNQSLQASCF